LDNWLAIAPEYQIRPPNEGESKAVRQTHITKELGIVVLYNWAADKIFAGRKVDHCRVDGA
jgi:hypothetical protein